MAQIINTNIASLTAQRNLNNSQSANATALERLSSGLRINSAKDDAAGLAISTRFTSQVDGLNVAIRNAGDGVSLAQTAEGAMGTITENLQRIRELAVQSSNATNSDEDRVALQQEVEQLMEEIGRTAEETEFNGQKLLNGDFEATFQIGANAGQTVDVKISELTVDKLGSSEQAGVSSYGTSTGLENGDLIINGEQIRASIASDDTLSTSDKEASGISKVAAINDSSAETGVVATVDENVMIGSDMDNAATATTAATITLNGVDISVQGTANGTETEKAATRSSVIAAINAKAEQTGVTAEDGGNDGGVVLKAADGRNIVMASTTNDLSAFGLADSDTGAATTEKSFAGFTLTAENASTDIEITGGDNTGNGNIANSGLQAGTYSAQTAVTGNQSQSVALSATENIATLGGATAIAGIADANTAAADLGLDITFAAADIASAAAATTAIEAAGYELTTAMAGVTNADFAIALGEAAASTKRLSDGDMTINGVAIQASSSMDDTASDTTAASSDGAASAISIAAAINKSSEDTGVTATVNATEVVGGEAPAGLVDGAGNAYDAATDLGQSLQLTINNVNVTLTETGDYEKNKTAAISAINEVSGQTGVVATDNGESLTLTAADGRNISLFADSATASEAYADLNTSIGNFGLSTTSVGIDAEAGGGADGLDYTSGAKTTYGTVTLESASAFEVGVGTNGIDGLTDSGFSAGTFGGGEDGQSLAEIDISTFEGAQSAIVAIDNALQTVSSQRAELGALQNRFESTVSTLEITSENLTAANSRIQDADFAAETAEMSRTSVLQQAGISILAQANQQPQQVLSLLG